jgi:hypothetical protein
LFTINALPRQITQTSLLITFLYALTTEKEYFSNAKTPRRQPEGIFWTNFGHRFRGLTNFFPFVVDEETLSKLERQIFGLCGDTSYSWNATLIAL